MIICLEKGDSLSQRYDVCSCLISVLSSCISLNLHLENPQNFSFRLNDSSRGLAK